MAAVWGSGCKSLDDYRQLQAENRSLAAEKVQLEDSLSQLRSGNETIRNRISGLQEQLADKANLSAHLQQQNDHLTEANRIAQKTLEEMAANYKPGDIAITGPKLPAQLDDALKTFANAYPSAVTYDAQRGTVKFKGDLLFALGSDVVVDSAKESLKGFTQIIKSPAASDFDALIVGHTDDTPIKKQATRVQHATNWHLSAHRAIAVANILIENGYPPNRTGIAGFSEYRPIADNASTSGKSQNRRVEIYLVPHGTLADDSAS